MLAEEAKQLIKYMASTWNVRLDDPQVVVVWVETLAPFPAQCVRQAITELRDELDWPPTHHQLTDRTRSVIRRTADERGLPAGEEVPEVCALCEGNRWAEAPPHLQRGTLVVGAVQRCRCQGRRVPECRANCSCLRCHYGGDRAALIRAGIDGVALSSEATDGQTNIRSIRSEVLEALDGQP